MRKFGLKPKVAPKIEGPELPYEFQYLWAWFCEHVMGLPVNGNVPPVVTWESLHAWCAFMRIDLSPWEALLMVRLGNLRATVITEKKTKPPDGDSD